MRWRVLALSLLLGIGAACSEDRPPIAKSAWPSSAGEDDGSLYSAEEPGVPDPDADELCGSVLIPLVFERQNLYFVVDASGSMNERIETASGRSISRYRAARLAIAELLERVGHRVRFGGSVFPARPTSSSDLCPPGEQLMGLRDGDPVSYAVDGRTGPALSRLLNALDDHVPEGSTPTARVLEDLIAELGAEEADTYVFLLTDGAPNCNIDAACGVETCTPNIEGACDPDTNCCDVALDPLAPLACLDDLGTLAAVRALAQAGVDTFVIGMPGTEHYEDFLGELAVAGRRARSDAPYYYPVDTAEDLSATLRALGGDVSLSCDIPLAEAPEAPQMVNLYFDRKTVPQDEADGWRWKDERNIEVVGAHCDLLGQGDVLEVLVAVGCPTTVY